MFLVLVNLCKVPHKRIFILFAVFIFDGVFNGGDEEPVSNGCHGLLGNGS